MGPQHLCTHHWFLSYSVILLALGVAAEVSRPLCLQKTPDPLQMEVAKG